MDEYKQYETICKPQFESILKKMAQKDEQTRIGQTVDLIYMKLFEGNGEKSLMVRVSSLEQSATTEKESSSSTRNWILGIVAAVIILVAQTVFMDWLATRNHLSQPTETKQAGK